MLLRYLHTPGVSQRNSLNLCCCFSVPNKKCMPWQQHLLSVPQSSPPHFHLSSSLYRSNWFHSTFPDVWVPWSTSKLSGKSASLPFRFQSHFLPCYTYVHKGKSTPGLWNNWLKAGLFRNKISTWVMPVRERKGLLVENYRDQWATKMDLPTQHRVSPWWGGLWG